MLKWQTTLNIVIRNKTGSFFNCAELWLNIRPTTLLYFNVGHYGGTWRAKYFLRWYLVLKI